MTDSPSKNDLKRWLREAEAQIEFWSKKAENFQNLLYLEEARDGKPKSSRNRAKKAETMELERKVKFVFAEHNYKPIKRGDLIAAIVNAYDNGAMNTETADGKLLHLKRSGFIIPERNKKYGFYELANKPRETENPPSQDEGHV